MFFSGWYDDCLLRKLPKTVGHYHYLVHCFLPVDVFCAGHIHEICRDMAPGSCWLFHDLHLSLWGLASWLVLSAIVAFLMNYRTVIIPLDFLDCSRLIKVLFFFTSEWHLFLQAFGHYNQSVKSLKPFFIFLSFKHGIILA